MSNKKSEVQKTFPVLNTDRLELIEIGDDHLEDLYQIFGDPEVTKFYNLKTLTKDSEAQLVLDNFQSKYRSGIGIRWGIALKGEKTIMGTIGFNNFTKGHRASIGYDLKKKHWNKGFISEALKEIVLFGFNILEVNRIEAEVMPGNTYSEKALLKTGFGKEGLLREWMFWNGKHYDMIMFSILRNK